MKASPSPDPEAAPGRWMRLLHSTVTAWIILLVSIGLTAMGWWVSSSYVERRAAERFQFEADRVELLVSRRMRIFQQMLLGTQGLFYASDEVTRRDWREYVDALDLPRYYAGVEGVGFARWIHTPEKADLENRVRAEGFPEFTIHPPGDRDGYGVTIFLEPFQGRNLRAFGFDMWSEPVRREAMRRACDENRAALSARVVLVQESDHQVQPGVLLYAPVYRNGAPTDTVEERRAALLGWVYSPFRMGDLLHGLLGQANPEIGFEVYDGETAQPAAFLFDSDTELGGEPPRYHPVRTELRRLQIAGRVWTVRCHTRPPFEADTASSQPFLIGFGGLLIDGLLFGIIWSLGSQRKRADQLVAERTGELRQLNATLQNEVVQRQRAEETLRELNARLEKRTVELEAAVGELQGFVYTVGHDLRSPLRSIHGFAEVIATEPHLSERARTALAHLSRSGLQLGGLVDDLLTFNRLGRSPLHLQVVDPAEIARRVLGRLKPDRTSLQIDLPATLPLCCADVPMLEQLLEELFENALEFTRDVHPARITLGGRLEDGFVHFHLRDNGPGFDSAYASRIFELFHRLHPAPRTGATGSGLAFARRIVEAHGGRIWAESAPGHGATFHFTLPAAPVENEKPLPSER